MGGARLLAGALALAMVSTGAAAPALGQAVDVAQGWTARQKVFWYTASQGSRLLPLSWLRALEQPGQPVPFLDSAHIDSFRYLPA